MGSVSSKNVPVPEVVHRIVAAEPPKTPSVLKVVPSQIVSSIPADTVAIGLIVSVITSTAARQGPAPSGSLEVMVKSTVTPAISAAEGVYTAPNKVLLSKVPVPAVVQVILVALPPITPDKVYEEPAQITSAPPEPTVAMRFIVSNISSDTATHGPAPSGSSVVMVNVTVPATTSAAEGVYTAKGSAGTPNAPVPEVVQRIKDADPPNEPAIV